MDKEQLTIQAELNQLEPKIDELQEKLVTMADELTVERAELRGRLWKLLEEQNNLLTKQILKINK